ncbi:MAG: glycosyltransferase family 9 protein [Pseudomonadota bacterium]
MRPLARQKTNPGADARRVLVIKLSALGDFVLALGAMEAVRRHHPSARITLLTTEPYKAFAEKCPYVDAVETDGRPDGVKATGALVSRIRKEKYDIVYDFQTSGRTSNYFRLLNLPGRRPPLWSGHAEGCAFPHDNPARGVMHSIDRLAEQLEHAGVAPEGGYTLTTKPTPSVDWIEPALGNAPRLTPDYFGLDPDFALIIPGASAHRSAKRWPPESFAEIARRIADAGVQPVMIGAKAEGDIAHAVCRDEPRVKNLVTRTDLFQIATLARRARFVVGNDTGPMHLSTIAGAPGVALFATDESDPKQAEPRGSTVIVVHAPTLEQVSPDDVWQAIRALGVLRVPAPA